jgi:cysteinyl-tRNA synthetase
LEFAREPKAKAEATPEILDLLTKRSMARAAKDFGQSDELRDKLLKLGISIKDSSAGQDWEWI